MDKWKVYDELIENIEDNYNVEYCFVSPHWVGVKSQMGLGLAMRMSDSPIVTKLTGNMKGMKLKDLAAYAKSWDFHEASIGMAALNSYYNGKNNNSLKNINESTSNLSIFDLIKDKVQGKKVTIVGHFPNIEKLREICQLTILERKPDLARFDLPDPACEYVLPEQDYLFTTAVTLINKTLPRLLELSKNAKTYLVGPTTPLTDIMINYGIECLSGSIVLEEEKAKDLFLEGAILQAVIKNKYIKMVNILKP